MSGAKVEGYNYWLDHAQEHALLRQHMGGTGEMKGGSMTSGVEWMRRSAVKSVGIKYVSWSWGWQLEVDVWMGTLVIRLKRRQKEKT